jgi:acyl-CoA synthetase (AMP-forming)/AMP-acid ligase II
VSVPSGLHELLRASTERSPDRIAFTRADDGVSYAELTDRASRFASALRQLGVERGDRVAVVLDGDVDYLVAFYGTLMAGAAAVPVCPDTRTAPLVHALAHCGAKVVVLDAANLRWLEGQARALPELRCVVRRDAPERGGASPSLEGFTTRAFAALLADARPGPDVPVAGPALAAVFYTSGTTGRPKGVMLTHGNLVANARAVVQSLDLTADERVALVLPFFYAYGNSVLHTHLSVGATIVQAGSPVFPAAVVAEMSRQRCTGLAGVPSTFVQLLALTTFGESALPELRTVTQAGAAMPPKLLRELRARLPRARVFLMYGQTEATARLACLPPERLDDKPGSVGRAIPGVLLAIRDADGNELPRGTVGEVVAQGPNVMAGYLRDPEASARVLGPHGLRTGDLGRMDDEGFLFLEGRASDLIKSGGHRIAPAEIEEVLSRAPHVLEAAVCGLPDDVLGTVVHGVVVCAQPVTRKELLDACHAELPQFKMPRQLHVVDALPRGPTGKLDRVQLAAWIAAARTRRL